MEFFDKLRLDEWFYEADQNIKDHRYADAMQTLEAILAEQPNYGKAYNHLGWLYETKYRDLKKAEYYYKKCLEIEPEYAPVYMNLAVVLSGNSKWQELDELLKKALETAGVDRAAIFNEYGIMYEMKAEYDEAIRHYKQAIRYTLKDTSMENYRNAIKRCKGKQELFND
ncbi:MAG: hypothetical protein JWN76_1394 [Chitinophagaceae bacterium]|nr:hypothetical protein [Chitinophagaceae bacterium]